MRVVLRSKIHRATVTTTDLNYEGSLTLDSELMKAADLVVGEQVAVLCLETGHRFETYVMEGEPNSGEVCVNGPAARLVQPGDRVIVMAYGLVNETEPLPKSRIVLVDSENRVVEVRSQGCGRTKVQV